MKTKCHCCQTVIDSGTEDTPDLDFVCPICGEKARPIQGEGPTPNQLIRNFELKCELGSGQYGNVWRAWDKYLKRDVAIKMPRSDRSSSKTVALFLSEAQALATLEHPNIVRVYDTFEEQNQIFIVTEFINGDNLRLVLLGRTYTLLESIRFVEKAARAIHYAHTRNIIHRDLKPGNILVDEDDEPMITDFGLAIHAGSEVTTSVSGKPMGTLPYLAPELAIGERDPKNFQCDVYSLGVILYEMTTGQRPFTSGSNLSDEIVLSRIRLEPPRPLREINPDIPERIEQICLKAMSKSKVDRQVSALELATELEQFADAMERADAAIGQCLVARPSAFSMAETLPNPVAPDVEQCQIEIVNAQPIVIPSTLTTAETLPAPIPSRKFHWASAAQFGIAFAFVVVCYFAVTPHFSDPTNKLPTVSIAPPLRPDVKVDVSITTDPPGAELAIFKVDAPTDEPQPDQEPIRPPGQTPLTVNLMTGYYRIVARLDEKRFHEVSRSVGKPGAGPESIHIWPHRHWVWKNEKTHLPVIQIPENSITRSMVKVEDNRPNVHVKPFFIDPHEVTKSDILDLFMKNNPNAKKVPEFLSNAGVGGGKSPMTLLMFDEAIEYAEKLGKRLPTDVEYEFVRTNGGTTIYPWGDEPQTFSNEPRSVEVETLDETTSQSFGPIRGLMTGTEFTSTILRTKDVQVDTAKATLLKNQNHPHWIELKNRILDFKVQTVVLRGDAKLLDHEIVKSHIQRDGLFRYVIKSYDRDSRLGFRGVRSVAPRGFSDRPKQNLVQSSGDD